MITDQHCVLGMIARFGGLRRGPRLQGGATKLKEYMRGLNMLPNKRKRKTPDDGPRSPTAHEHSHGSARPLLGELLYLLCAQR